MRLPSHTPASQLMASLVLAALVGMAAWAVAVPILRTHDHYDDAIADLRFQLQKYGRLAARQPQFQAEFEGIQARRPSGRDLLGGAGDALAGAALQELVKKIIHRAGGTFNSSQVLAASAQGGLRRIPVQVKFSGDVSALQQVLHAIEAGKPQLFIAALRVELQDGRPARGRSPGRRSPRLEVTLDVFGYRRDRGEA